MFPPKVNGDKKCRKERPRWANVRRRRIYGADGVVASRITRERRSASHVALVNRERCEITGGKRKDDQGSRVSGLIGVDGLFMELGHQSAINYQRSIDLVISLE